MKTEIEQSDDRFCADIALLDNRLISEHGKRKQGGHIPSKMAAIQSGYYSA